MAERSWISFSGIAGDDAKPKIARPALRVRYVPRLLEFFRRVRVLQELVGWNHRDAIPRADLVAERAADAAGEVDGADLEDRLVAMTGDDADAVDRADRHARLAAGAHVFVKQRESFG